MAKILGMSVNWHVSMRVRATKLQPYYQRRN